MGDLEAPAGNAEGQSVPESSKTEAAEPKKITRSMTESEFKAEVESNFSAKPIGGAPIYKHTSCFCLKPDNSLRKTMINIAHAKWFDNFILFLILVNCFMMMLDAPYALCCPEGDVGDLKEIYSVSTPACKNGTTHKDWTYTLDGCAPKNMGVVQCDKDTNMITYYMTSPEEPEENYPSRPSLVEDDGPEKVMTNQGCCTPKPWALSNGLYQSQLPDSERFKDVRLNWPSLCVDLSLHQINGVLEYVFLVCFTIEMVIKMIAMSPVGRWPKDDTAHGGENIGGGYLNDAWNWLDFIVVVSAYLSLIPGVSNVAVLRTFRVLRPLRTVNTIPGMKTIVKAILKSLLPLR